MDGQPRTAAERLRDWLDARPEVSQSALAARCHVARQRISDAVKGGAVSLPLRKALERETGIEVDAWDGSEAAPASEERAATDEPLGTTPEELRASARRLKVLARRPGLTPGQQATLEGKLATVLCRLDERAKALEEHPAFDDHIEDVLTALEKTLTQYGVSPNGARTVFADHLEALEAKRARKAA